MAIVKHKIKRRTWSKSDLKLLKEKYTDTPMQELMELFGCSSRAIYGQCFAIGAKRSPEFIANNLGFKPGSEVGKDLRFKKGIVAFNAGKKQHEYMSEEAIAKTLATRFKPGHKPHNTKCGNNHISIRNDKRGVPQKFIKLADGVWVYLSRYNWEQNFGPIPEGHVIAFKDRDTLNCEPHNLMCLSKAENMRRNSYHNNYTEEMKEVVVMRAKITRRVKKLTKK